MKRSIICCVSTLALFLMGGTALGQHYTDWTGYEFKPRGEGMYEVQRDYTISLPEYFLDPDKLPEGYGEHIDTMHSWAENHLPPCDWDFIRLEEGGILTIKKGYRCDGPSYPEWLDWLDWIPGIEAPEVQYYHYRAAFVHDVLYELMRLEYLEPDTDHKGSGFPRWCKDEHSWSRTGDLNRMMADMMIYMIGMEDGQPLGPDNNVDWGKARADFNVLRKRGACATHDDGKLKAWKFHVSELTAYASDGKVELYWKRPDEAQKDPDFGGHFDPWEAYSILRDGQEIAVVDAVEWNFPDPPVFFTSYEDNTVVNGTIYRYQVIPHTDNNNQYDWSGEEYVVPMSGAGNALLLDGVDDYVEANTVSNDLCAQFHPNPPGFTIEAWVCPAAQTSPGAIVAFNTISGDNRNMILYDGAEQKFCYYDPTKGMLHSSTQSEPDRWYHVALTIDEFDSAILYVDGEEQLTFSTEIRPSHGAQFSIGQAWDGPVPTRHFKGMIDEVRVWAGARTPEQIQEDMCALLRGDETGLVSLWHFDEPNDHFVLSGFPTPVTVRKGFDATANASDGVLSGYENADIAFVPSGAMGNVCLPPIQVSLDIKPGSCPNPLNAKNKPGKGKSVLPVAILGTEDFDVSDIDPETITLEGVSPVRWSYEDVATPVAESDDICACTEEEADGFDDLTLKFDRRAVIEAILSHERLQAGGAGPHNNNSGPTERTQVALLLTAELYDYRQIEGSDCVTLMTKDNASASPCSGTPRRIALLGNHPNPFNPTTQIDFFLPQASTVRVDILNLLGQTVETLVSGPREAGYHSVEWHASHVASGIYLYRLQSGSSVETRKMLLLK